MMLKLSLIAKLIALSASEELVDYKVTLETSSSSYCSFSLFLQKKKSYFTWR